MNRYHNAEGRQHVNACLGHWPWSRSAAVHLWAARLARRDSDFPDAETRLHQCQDRLGGDKWPDAVLEWELYRAAIGDLATVEQHLKDRCRTETNNIPLILEALSEGYLRMARMTEAMHCVDEWLKRQPDNVQALSLRCKINQQAGAVRKCVDDYRRILELDPDFPDARRWLAMALLDIGRYAEAVEHLEILRRKAPDDPDLLVRLAIGRRFLGQGPEAHRLLERVLAEHPNFGLALRTRGQIAKENSQLAEAESWLRKAQAELPYDLRTLALLTDCLKSQGKTKEAQEQGARQEQLKDRLQRRAQIMTHYMTLHRNDPALHCELGQLNIQLGQPQAGEGWLLSALRLDEAHVPALRALAELYEERGDTEKAEEFRRRARAVSDAAPPRLPGDAAAERR